MCKDNLFVHYKEQLSKTIILLKENEVNLFFEIVHNNEIQ
jgi:hypothetical protein